MNEEGRNHDSLWSILDNHDGNIKYRCYETKKEHIKPQSVKKIEPVLFTEME